MPEVWIDIEWPDGSLQRFYSPSTVVTRYFQAGTVTTIAELLKRSSEAFQQASERVRERYGFACSAASDQLERIQSRAGEFPMDARITIQGLTEGDSK